jgi:hypothetical protein
MMPNKMEAGAGAGGTAPRTPNLSEAEASGLANAGRAGPSASKAGAGRAGPSASKAGACVAGPIK